MPEAAKPNEEAGGRPSGLTEWLAKAPPALFSTYAIASAFGVYFAMYAFRKPFTAATFEGEFGEIGYKTIFVISQVAGYTLSKFIGVRVIAEMQPGRRAASILGLIAVAHLALLAFAVIPPPWNAACLFINGLPLGLIFGLVLSFLEGRRLTELLTAGLCASFIVSSGVVKSIGQSLIVYGGVSEYWMPFFTGLAFWPLIMIGVWLLSHIPPPNELDEQERSVREPIGRELRRGFLRRHGVGFMLLILVFILLTILRSLRDDFAVEIWAALGVGDQPSIFGISETVVMLLVVALNGAAFLIRDNARALNAALLTIGGGFIVIVLATLGLQQGLLGGFAFMVLIGFGAYAPYVAFHTTLFERIIALSRDRANLGFLIYLADSTGYLGYVAVLLYKNFGASDIDFLQLLIVSSLVISAVSLACVAWAALTYRARVSQAQPAPEPKQHALQPAEPSN